MWRVTFSEAVQNVNQTDFTVTGAGIGNPDVAVVAVTNTGDTTYDVTASGSNLADLDATVTLDFDSAQNIQDTSGNALTTTLPAAAANTYEVDNTAPTVAITTDVTGTTTAGAFTATVTFSETVKNFVAGDIVVVGATKSSFTEASAGTEWTVLLIPSVNGMPVTVNVAEDVATDAAGNGNEAASQ